MELRDLDLKKTAKLIAKCTPEQKNFITAKAMLYTKGNLSKYILYAAMNFLPEGADFKEETKKKKGKKK